MSKPLYPFQENALRVLRGEKQHLILTAPTGSGKGRILEELSKDPGERILLITPLIALARQQLRRMRDAGVNCHCSVGRGSSFDPGPNQNTRVWILSPESLTQPKRTAQVKTWKPTLFAIDEAHCVEEWGEDFRPAYGILIAWLRNYAANRTLWMSATFPRSLTSRLERSLPGKWTTLGMFALPGSLTTQVHRIAYGDRIERARAYVHDHPTSGILFAGTRKASENYARLFQADNRVLIPYHAGMSDEERRAVEAMLSSDANPMGVSVAATNAFGMGMDFSRLDWVLLCQTPLSLLSLMQAFGRVARGGRTGVAEILWCEEDFRISGYLIRGSTSPGRAEKRLERLRLFLEASAKDRISLLDAEFI